MYPVALSVRGRRAVVVGGGAVAARKVRGLLDARAEVAVVAPRLAPALAALAEAGEIVWIPRRYEAGDLAGAFLAFAATGDPAADAAVVSEARAAGTLVNDASDAERGDFATPAVHRAGSLTVTVDSGGLSPSFTKRVRDELALQFDARYARAAATLGALRERVKVVVPPAQRAAVMAHFAERDIEDLAAMPPGAVEHEVERAAETLAGVVPSETAALRCATRASKLALVQARAVMAALAKAGLPSTVLEVTTRGDAVQDRSIAAIGTDNVFVKELELALRERRADYAVHSCKDLPSALPADMTLAAVTAREDARDAFCSERYASFAELPAGARVGTSSPRRRAQLRALRPDLVYDDVRGNVDTRLRKLREGQYDAIVLACAGLDRLGVCATHTVPFAPDEVTPAVGQGALGIETLAGEPVAARLRELLEDPVAAIAVRAERAFLRTCRGGCQAPIGCHATWSDGRFRITGAIAAADGSDVLRSSAEAALDVRDVASAEALATDLARELLDRGGLALLGAVATGLGLRLGRTRPGEIGLTVSAAPMGDLIDRLRGRQAASAHQGASDGPVRPDAGPLTGHVFLLPRTQDRPSRIAPALRDAGAEVVEAPDSEAAAAALGPRVPTAILFPSSGSVGAIGEYLGRLRYGGHRPLVAAMGPSSSEAAAAQGWPPDVTAPSAEIGAFVQTVTRFVLEKGS